jgi:hypothetical protein
MNMDSRATKLGNSCCSSEHIIILCGIRVSAPPFLLTVIVLDITPYSLLKVKRRFGATCRLNLRCWRVSQAQMPALCWFLIFNPEDGGDMFLLTFSWWNCVISQRRELFMLLVCWYSSTLVQSCTTQKFRSNFTMLRPTRKMLCLLINGSRIQFQHKFHSLNEMKKKIFQTVASIMHLFLIFSSFGYFTTHFKYRDCIMSDGRI